MHFLMYAPAQLGGKDISLAKSLAMAASGIGIQRRGVWPMGRWY